MTAVIIAPANTPTNGLLNAVKMWENDGESFSGSTDSPIIIMPVNRTENPTKIRPISLVLLCLAVMIIMIPMRANTGENDSGLMSFRKTLSPLMPDSASSQTVKVVPMLEPMRMPMVCPSCIMPELTKPTNMTVTAEEDCTAAVMPTPNSRLFHLFEVIFCRITSSLPPASFSKPEDMTFMPYKKNARPPNRVRKEKISIRKHILFSIFRLFFQKKRFYAISFIIGEKADCFVTSA